MDHFLLFLVCLAGVEILFRSNLVKQINSLILIFRKIIIIIPNKKVSDHWKEKLVPYYSLIIMKKTVCIFFILSIILLIFLVPIKLSNTYLDLILTTYGIIESVLFAYIIFKLRNSLSNE